jgi:hypothetical protein
VYEAGIVMLLLPPELEVLVVELLPELVLPLVVLLVEAAGVVQALFEGAEVPELLNALTT